MKFKTAKSNVFTIDIECPHCGGLIANTKEDGQLSFSVHEAIPAILKCHDCGSKSKAPSKVKGHDLTIDGAE